MDIKFSIVIPTYKAIFLKECIDSVLAQSYINFELIIVNDASPYDIDSIINSYNDNRISYHINEKGYGAQFLVDNWNNCLKYVTGDYIICMGDDDKLKENCLENYLKAIKSKPDYNVYHTQTEIINEKSKVTELLEERPEWESVYSMIWHLWKGRRQFIGDWLFASSFLKTNGFFNLPFAWGADHMTAIMAAGDQGIININMPGFQYRENQYNITKNSSNTKFKIQAMHLAKQWYIAFLKKEPILYKDKIYKETLVNNLDTHFRRRIAFDISERLRDNKISIFYWFYNRKKYRIDIKTLLLAMGFTFQKILIK